MLQLLCKIQSGRNVSTTIETATAAATKGKPSPASTSAVNAHNEWDPLEEVIVGRVEGATVPSLSLEVKVCVVCHLLIFLLTVVGYYIALVIETFGDTNVERKHGMYDVNLTTVVRKR